MKRVILLAVLFVVGTTAFAQLPKFNLGLKAGMNIAKLKSDFTAEENRLGYQGGLWARIGAAGFYIQPEAYLGSKGGQFSFSDDNESVIGTAKVKFTNFDIPILFGTKIGSNKLNAHFMAGPVISFVVNDNTTFAGMIPDKEDFQNYKDQTWGGQVGAGVDLGNLSFDLRYETGLSDIHKSSGRDTKQNLWHISLGYKLF